MKPFEDTVIVDTDRAWIKLKGRLQHDGLIKQDQPIRKLHSTAWMKWAASLLILVVAGSIAYFSLTTRPRIQYFALTTGSDNLTLVKTLEDGSVVYLADNTTLTYPPVFSDSERRVQVAGAVYFDVVPSAGKPFVIETTHALIEVVGTGFSLKTNSDHDLELFVENGLVRVNLGKDNKESVMVEAGELLLLNGYEYQKTFEGNLFLSQWRQNRMHFKDERIENILSVINSNYQSDIRLQNATLAERQLTVTFYNNSLSTIIELLCLSMDLEAQTQADSSILLIPK